LVIASVDRFRADLGIEGSDRFEVIEKFFDTISIINLAKGSWGLVNW